MLLTVISFSALALTFSASAGIQDGTSNTILIGETVPDTGHTLGLLAAALVTLAGVKLLSWRIKA